MEVGRSVSKAIDEACAGDLDSAMLHACNAVDGTATKSLPTIKSNNLRFTTFLRDNFLTLGVMGMPGIDLVNTRFPIEVARPKAPGGGVDIADIIYGIHRCAHGHGEALPDGFSLHRDSKGPSERTTISIQGGRIQLSDRMIFALVATAVFAPENIGQSACPHHLLTLGSNHSFIINEWWGRREEFESIAAALNLPNVKLNLGEWMTS